MAFIKEFADKMGYVGDERMLLSANASIAERFRNNYVDLAFKLDLAKDVSIFIKGDLGEFGVTRFRIQSYFYVTSTLREINKQVQE